MHSFHSALVALAALCALLIAEPTARAADTPASDKVKFTRHVVPLFSRLGCNQGTCHGAVKGQGGFRLSLFGADPQADHQSLLRDLGGRRLDQLTPANSLFLRKATSQVPHQGGRRTAVDSADYRLLLAWIKSGFVLDAQKDSRVKTLTVTPLSGTLVKGGHADLKVKATFADGTSEDVTRFCTFEALSTDVATVDANGRVIAQGVGDTAIVVRYGAEPTMAQFVVPRVGKEAFPDIKTTHVVDKHILAKLKKLNLPPTGACDDLTFLRRACLDVTGALPEPAEIRKFLADKSADKRTKKIDELLRRSGHAALWATKFSDLLKISKFNANYAFVEAAETRRVHDWLQARFKENLPYDQLVERILTATSREGRSVEDWTKEVSAMAQENAAEGADLKVYAKRKTLDLYWQREGATGIKGALQVAHAFLGLRMECAQCHRHPHDVWKQEDLLGFANFFMRIKGASYPNPKALPPGVAELLKKGPAEAKKLREQVKKLNDKLRDRKLPMEDREQIKKEVAQLNMKARVAESGPKRFGTEVMHESKRQAFASVSSPLGTQRSNVFRLLGDPEPVKVAADKDSRQLVMDWLRSPKNPFFAKAIVNRIWAHYFGRGLVDPPDNLSPLNPASHPELLDELAQLLIKSKFDLRVIHRTILTSRTYQQSARPHPVSKIDRRNYAYFYLRRLPAEVLVDAVNHATKGTETYPERLYLKPATRAIEVPGITRVENKSSSLAFAFQVFGRPLRDPQVQCDCDRDPGVTIVQTLYLANHPQVRAKIAAPTGRVALVMKEHKETKRRIEELYLWTLSRLPKADEVKVCEEYVKDARTPEAGFQDVMWSLLNTREFILNH